LNVEGGTLEGTVNYCGSTGPEYLPVYIPGESFMSVTSQTGFFRLSDITEGTYDLKIDTPGPVHHTVQGIEITNGSATSLGTVKICCSTVVDTDCICPDGQTNTTGVCFGPGSTGCQPENWVPYADLHDCEFSDPYAFFDRDLNHVNLTGTNLSGFHMEGVNLTGANLSFATLIGTDLRTATLEATILIEANLTNATLIGRATLAGAIMTDAILIDASMGGANLTKAYLTGANLTGAILRFANLAGANLTDANLTGANLTDAILTDVIWDNTTCPDGTNSDDNGGTCVGHLTTP
jgi:uncharacterized protein YjbI with pentapeptide repeats